MPTDTHPSPVALRAARDWLGPYFNDLDDALARITREVEPALADYHDRGLAGVDLQPGNGTSYIMVFTALTRLDRDAGHDAGGWYQPVDAVRAFGGDLLVSLPEFHRATVLSTGALHFPDYVEEKMSLGLPHACVIAAFLTLFDDALTLTPPSI